MERMIKKVLLGLVLVVVLVFMVFAGYVGSRQHLKFDRPYPAVTASTDSAVVARGHYVVRRLANCAQCHGDPKLAERNLEGEEVPLSGGFAFKIPPGEFFARNITPDAATGIGRFTDGEVARALRSGVGHDGRALLPFMEMQGLSDEDLTAVVSYLRSQPPVSNPVPSHKPNLLGQIVIATVLANPVGPKETPLKASPRGATLENGKYLAESIALCWSCHTQRDMKTGALVGARFGGANMPDDNNPKRTWAPPNLTSDPTTGRLAKFSEDEFVARFRQGRVIPGSPMPWQGFRNLEEDDVRAIYRYLKSLPPVVHDVGPPYVDKP
jgi:mono/diheme cytochrome c family protein